MRVIDVHKDYKNAPQYLWDLMKERPENSNISHKAMPTWDEHIKFIESHPYYAWYLLQEDNDIVGAVYLTKQCEIGVFIFKKFQGRGLGKLAVDLLMKLHPRKHYLANINPGNGTSLHMFEKLGFKHIQSTYRIDHD